MKKIQKTHRREAPNSFLGMLQVLLLPETLTVPVPADRFLLQAPVMSASGFKYLSLSMFIHPTLLSQGQFSTKEGSCYIQTPASSLSGGVSEAFSVQFLRGSQHYWSRASHSGNLLIIARSYSFLTFYILFSYSFLLLCSWFTFQIICLNSSLHFRVLLGKLNLTQVVKFICMFVLRSILYLLLACFVSQGIIFPRPPCQLTSSWFVQRKVMVKERRAGIEEKPGHLYFPHSM